MTQLDTKSLYESPELELVSLKIEGIICLSFNGIGDVEFEYDESVKE
ncbi:MAG: hypothetical protein IIX64_06260 [Bacteroidales bacterium]|nr:hypothetical protein [Bacteroidales bacterium]